MTRKDFVAIATALANAITADDSISVAQAHNLVRRFTDGIAHTNPNFDRQRFVNAVINGIER
jgi:hypothetical protein